MADKKVIYDRLIERAKTRSNATGYTERHHIIPRSLGGSDDHSNIVVLTAKEHYIAHRLLAKFTTGQDKHKMAYALFNMCTTSKQRPRYVPNARSYALIKAEMAESMKESCALMTKEERLIKYGVRLGTTQSADTRQKISDSSKKPKSATHKANISTGKRGIKFSDSHIENLKLSHRGVKQTESRKKNTSEVMKRWWADRKAIGGDNRR